MNFTKLVEWPQTYREGEFVIGVIGSSPIYTELEKMAKTKKEFAFSNGDSVEEKVTGFKGTITGTSFYITGCNMYLVTAKAKDEFSEAKSHWYDEGRLTIVKDSVVTIKDVEAVDNGCDMLAPNKG